MSRLREFIIVNCLPLEVQSISNDWTKWGSLSILYRRPHKRREQGMGTVWAAFEFRVELAAQHEGMIFQFDDFHQSRFRPFSRENQTFVLQLFL